MSGRRKGKKKGSSNLNTELSLFRFDDIELLSYNSLLAISERS